MAESTGSRSKARKRANGEGSLCRDSDGAGLARSPGRTQRGSASGAPGRRASLTETVREMLETRQVSPGIDRQSMVDLGLRYLDDAERLAPAMAGDEA